MEARGVRRDNRQARVPAADASGQHSQDIRRWCAARQPGDRDLFRALKKQRRRQQRLGGQRLQHSGTQTALARRPQTAGNRGLHKWLRTQNTRGLVKTAAIDWFQHLRRLHGGEEVGVTLIQETHCSAADAAQLERQYAGLWGYRADRGPRLSYWSHGARAGGVAILLHPNDQGQWTPALSASWSPHFIALEGTMDGVRTLVCNFYAPTDRAERERLFTALLAHDVSKYARVVAGGDFNCTQDQRDRSTGETGRHYSSALDKLLSGWGLVDAASTPGGGADWTYFYTTAHGEERASRLDRWYISVDHSAWVRRTSTIAAPCNADHRGVLLGLAHPTRQRVRRPRTKLYPRRVRARGDQAPHEPRTRCTRRRHHGD